MSWVEGITLAIALLGAALGILNTWIVVDQQRVRLRVTPAFAISQHGIGFSIEVTNLSSFPLTINEVGVTLPSRKRAVVTDALFLDGKGWPRRLEPRETVTAYFDPAASLPRSHMDGSTKAYAHTACGEFAYGNSPALRQLREQGVPA